MVADPPRKRFVTPSFLEMTVEQGDRYIERFIEGDVSGCRTGIDVHIVLGHRFKPVCVSAYSSRLGMRNPAAC